MEKYTLTKDMKLILLRAKSFPDGIQEAFDELIKKTGGDSGRTFFGVSHADRDTIIYKAGVLESFEGEGEKLGCETLVVTKGDYMTITINNWKQNKQKFGEAFQELISYPKMDYTFPCVEWYKGDEVLCMVRIDPKK
jgi:hypothetical protein